MRMRALAWWRMLQAERFGEQQLVMHTGKDLPVCKEIQRRAWPWAFKAGMRVRQTNGQEEIETEDGSRWMVRGRGSVYGYDVCLGMVDEAWAVDAAIVDDGLEPAMLDRVQPQLMLTSTAHRRATSLMRERRAAALAQFDDPVDTLMMHWGSVEGEDPADPAVWQAAQPFWSAQKARDLGRHWSRIQAGTQVPDPDEPDPVEAWKAQYLNMWPPPGAPVIAPWIAPGTVLRVLGDPGDVSGGVGAIESSKDGRLWSAALALQGRAVVTRHTTSDDAIRWLVARGASVLLCHQAVAAQLVNVDLEVVTVTQKDAVAATAILRELVEGELVAIGGDVAGQFGAVVLAHSDGGARVDATRARGDVDAVKCLSWALWFAQVRMPEVAAIF